ncbi:MAG TPA: hypothetical protein VMV19_00425 [Xanthobacteraceae bacterium]|nr:hypothetical protein [Xanthobacteraceae bacterium]
MKIGSILFLLLFSGALATTAWAEDWQEHDNNGQTHGNNWQTHDNNWQGNDGQYACMSDAMTVCGRFIPDRGRVAHCLMSNRSRVSVACRAALTHWRG